MKIKVPAAGWMHRLPAAPQVAMPETRAYQCVAIGLDFAGGEDRLLAEAKRFLGPVKPRVFLLHVVESPVARAVGEQAADRETSADRHRLQTYAEVLREAGIEADWRLGAGDPVKELVRLLGETGADLLILGAHRHRGVSDLVHGATANALRHAVDVPVLLVPVA